MNILMIDDDMELCELLQRFLAGEGFSVQCIHHGAQGLALALAQSFDMILLDVMMPGKNGMDVLRELREHSQVPVMMLTARGEEMDRIIGLELGADDYLPKPFNPRELAARMRAILRRQPQAVEEAEPTGDIRVGSLRWLLKSRRVMTVHGEGQTFELTLTTTEYALLTCLIQQADAVVSKQQAGNAALGRNPGPFDRSLDVHIASLRKKLRDASCASGVEAPSIQTIRGVGWMLVSGR
ncbi:MAG: DNA-binding response regulator [Zetaproteobacteria bacterium CG_4_9_14_3_um_filter_49_83]|nr:MAG: DNA-binding response regulator [Zetaproteobacteria bacterium CG1_02_49_23]PIQ30101.1 MAG: DNA-binding response regulator [Zetaproteobacteria bacterium CG17_big_fil_post_rev_8_21_14_2_50_50_13]PIV31529.1 MAG: DNA-binding response regulator [Zetaproteobacteria bacterium CG02_land_8_20_14_3_00_50_9]PIY55951.1 MAG: DNA-binding response regulator [Zetaproteobacteria bacterium CG_4_10_14_0_8_um_filter_49_80]PJA36373.1 MAG: DNA-binding response regulator [Zetaproteobacteria bacterium CG_4_9_14